MITNIFTTRRLIGLALAAAIAALIVAPSAAHASTTNPAVKIGPATDISANSAIVHGAVNPEGCPPPAR
jgi:hypothetical protein